MPIYTLKRTQRVSWPLDECWRFFSDARNLSRITPPEMRFRVLSQVPDEIYAGMMIEYRVSPLLGIPVSWLTEITHVDAPHRFIDEQRVGPYAIWHHEHTFVPISERETEVRDLVHYVPPFGPLGGLLNRLVIAPQLARIFRFRENALAQISRDSAT